MNVRDIAEFFMHHKIAVPQSGAHSEGMSESELAALKGEWN